MIKSIFSKVAWVTRGTVWLAKGTSILVGLTVMVAVTAGVVSTATAANGSNFILGNLNNAATAITKLTANIANPALELVNTSTGTNATALKLQTATSKPPMTVNTKTKVANLNTDSVDGKSAEQLTRVASEDLTSSTVLPLDGTEILYGQPLSITAPAAGFVRINANATAANSGCTTNCAFTGQIRHANVSSYSWYSQEDVNTKYGNISLDDVFPVSAGENTFEIRLWRSPNGNGAIYGWWGSITAEYTPYGPTGTGTLGTASATSASSSPEEFDKKEP